MTVYTHRIYIRFPRHHGNRDEFVTSWEQEAQDSTPSTSCHVPEESGVDVLAIGTLRTLLPLDIFHLHKLDSLGTDSSR